jgi:signal transduction histidine kinase
MQEAGRIMAGGGRLREFELTIATRTGDRRDTLAWVEWIDVGGEPCVVGYHLDITDRKRAEQELRRLNAELEQRVTERDALLAREHAARADAEEALRLRDEFLATASHELKTPLTSFHLLYQSMEQYIRRNPESPDPDRLLHHLAVGDRQLKRLIRLSNDLLDIARLSGGGLMVERVEADLVEIVHEAVSVVVTGSVLGPDMIRVEAPSLLQGRWDRLRLEQVIVNLLTNAVKFGERNPIEVTIERCGDLARIEVRDKGIGIPPEDHERIFGRVERAVPAEHYGGLGIGLYIAEQIVHAHGGTISVESAPGEGSTFTVELPLQESPGAGQ